MMFKRYRVVYYLAILVCLASTASSCTVHKSEFNKKKWKIKKGYPPVQKYYMKWSILRKK